jgi:hypothetical protein
MKALITPKITYLPLPKVAPAPVDKVERHLVTQAIIAEVSRAINKAIYEQGLL